MIFPAMVNRFSRKATSDNKLPEVKAKGSFIEAYLLLDVVSQDSYRRNYRFLLKSIWKRVQKDLSSTTLFLDRKKAMKQFKYLSENKSLLHVLIPDDAIHSNGHALVLKPGALSLESICGCFPGDARGEYYHENPAFTESLVN